MALRFSEVTMKDGHHESRFFVLGFPQEPEQMDGWTAYRRFLEELTEDTTVDIQARAFLYGDEDVFDATPEEVAYITMRDERDPGFLSRCQPVGEASFNFHWCPKELFGTVDTDTLEL